MSVELQAVKSAGANLTLSEVRPLKTLMAALLSGATLPVRRDLLLKIVISEPVFVRWKKERYFYSRPERIRHALFVCKRIVELKFSLKLNADEMAYLFYLADDLLPIQTHETIFIPYLKEHGTDEQVEFWAKKAGRYEIIGCYAQTELGHGSNIGQLETTASFVQETDEWEINSPTLTSTKWWIGGLGIVATHAIVMAQMIINNEKFGVFPFIVQIRGTNSHTAMPGIAVGDVGPKLGSNSMDNGFVRFHHVRIPRTNLLMKYVRVSRNGQFESIATHSVSKLVYSSMLKLRIEFVSYSALALARAATISIRYCTHRRQFGPPAAEQRVIEYQSVQYRLFPILAATYAFAFTSHALSAQYRHLLSTENANTFDKDLSCLHASSTALKSYCTAFAAKSIEVCRMACGGHGYSQFSGFADAYGTFVHMCTAEGENWVLTQQSTRWLLKQFGISLNIISGNGSESLLSEDSKYILDLLRRRNNGNQLKMNPEYSDFVHSDILIETLKFRSFWKISCLYEILKQFRLKSNPNNDEEKSKKCWNSLHILIYQVSEAHAQYIICRKFLQYLNGPIPYPEKGPIVEGTISSLLKEPIKMSNKNLFNPLKLLFYFLSLYWIDENAGDYLKSEFLSQKQLSLIKITLFGYDELIQTGDSCDINRGGLLKAIHGYAVPLTNGLSIPDYVTNSAIGNGDGRVYERMWDWAVLGGIFSSYMPIPTKVDSINSDSIAKLITKNNINRIYNRELYKGNLVAHLPGLNSLGAIRGKRSFFVDKSLPVPSNEGGITDFDGDQETEKDKAELDSIREWQEVHALVIRPMVTGLLADKKDGKNSKL